MVGETVVPKGNPLKHGENMQMTTEWLSPSGI